MLVSLEKKLGGYLALLGDRMRAAWWRTRGFALGGEFRIGHACRIERPWRLSTGKRVQLEHQIYIKITGEEAQVGLGDEVFIGSGTELDISDSLTLGNHVLVAPGCFITDHNHRHGAHDHISAQGCVSEQVVIEDDAWLGGKAVVLPGIRIGTGAVVGAGAIVSHDVDAMTVVAGVPARVIVKRE